MLLCSKQVVLATSGSKQTNSRQCVFVVFVAMEMFSSPARGRDQVARDADINTASSPSSQALHLLDPDSPSPAPTQPRSSNRRSRLYSVFREIRQREEAEEGRDAEQQERTSMAPHPSSSSSPSSPLRARQQHQHSERTRRLTSPAKKETEKDFALLQHSQPSTPAAAALTPAPTPSLTHRSQPSSPARRTPRSQPSSRASSPLKRQSAARNAVLEVGRDAFYFSIELPESKIVPKKDVSAPGDSAAARNGHQYQSQNHHHHRHRRSSSISSVSSSGTVGAGAPAKSTSPKKELLKRRAEMASPSKSGSPVKTKDARGRMGMPEERGEPRGASVGGGTAGQGLSVRDARSMGAAAEQEKYGSAPATPVRERRGIAREPLGSTTPNCSPPKRVPARGAESAKKIGTGWVETGYPANIGEMIGKASGEAQTRRKEEKEVQHSSPTVLDLAGRKNLDASERPGGGLARLKRESMMGGNATTGEERDRSEDEKQEKGEASSSGGAYTPPGTPPALRYAMQQSIGPSSRPSLGASCFADSPSVSPSCHPWPDFTADTPTSHSPQTTPSKQRLPPTTTTSHAGVCDIAQPLSFLRRVSGSTHRWGLP